MPLPRDTLVGQAAAASVSRRRALCARMRGITPVCDRSQEDTSPGSCALPSLAGSAAWSASRWLSLAALGTIILADLTLRRSFVYDERPYLTDSLRLLDQFGLTREFLWEYPYPAGISFGIMHWVLRPITRLRPELVRLVNPILFLLVLWLTSRIAAHMRCVRPRDRALTMMGIPFLWVLIGLALTEMVAMLCASLAVLCLLLAMRARNESSHQHTVLAFVAGLVLGIGFYSRPSVLVIALAAPALAGHRPERWTRVFGFCLGAAVPVLPCVALWGGLVPPKVHFFDVASFSWVNMLLSLGYGGIAMCLVCPSWCGFRPKAIIALLVLSMGFNTALHLVAINSLRSVADRLVPDSILPFYPTAAGGLLVGVAVLFVAATLRNVWRARQDSDYLFLALSLLLMVVSVGKITHQFSSRYTALAAPLMVAVGGCHAGNTAPKPLWLAAGVAIGGFSLASYLLWAQ